jgi:hypothetical protein
MAEQVASVQGEPKHRDRSLFSLFVKKKEEKVGRNNDPMMDSPDTRTEIQNPSKKLGLVDKIKQKLPGRRKK